MVTSNEFKIYYVYYKVISIDGFYHTVKFLESPVTNWQIHCTIPFGNCQHFSYIFGNFPFIFLHISYNIGKVVLQLAGVGDRIEYLRKKLNLTQKQLAEKAGITEASLSRYENNLREPKAEIISKLAIALGTTTDFLLGQTDNPVPGTCSPSILDTNVDISDLPDAAIQQVKDYIEFIKQKYKSK